MNKVVMSALLLFVMCLPAQADPKVVLVTNLGEITVELNEGKAPKTVENFLSYVEEGFYAQTIFHRVIPGFMIQGGGFDTSLKKKPTHAPIENEAANGLKNDRGTIAMARTRDVHSATAQFYINVVDNDFLNYSSSTASGFGYAVFGKVVDGMDVVDKIAATPTERRNGLFQNLPSEQVVIKQVRRLTE